MPAEPRAITARRSPLTYGPRVARLSAGLGMRFMPWQRLAADLFGERDDAGLRINPFGVLTVQRQAGKTELIQAMAVDRCLNDGEGQRVWYTAQNGAMAAEKWAEVATRLSAESSPLAGYVAARWARGSECLTFPNGSTFRPFPPTKDALHSKQGDLVLVDEAWKHDLVRGAELLQAISPTQSTRPGAQTILLSTMGTRGGSQWFHGFVDRGRAGDPAITYLEFGIGDEGDPEDMALVCGAHPAVGHTITPEFVAAQLPILGPSEFARAFGNARTAVTSTIISAAAWTAIRHRDATPADGSSLVLAFDVEVDRSATAIVAVWPDPDGVPVLEVVDYRPGVGWAGPRLAELVATHRPVMTVADGTGPVLTVVDDARRAGVDVTQTNGREYTAACAGMLDKITAGAVLHRGDPALDSAVAGATRRPVGDGWGWSRRTSGVGVAALIAGSLAVWGHPRRPAPSRPVVAAG